MPKIDPITGCEVMTLAEFWQAEAQAEGKGRSGADVATDFYQQMAQEMAEDELRLKNDPATCWQMIHDLAQADLQAWQESAEENGQTHTYQRWDSEKGGTVTETSEPHDAGPRPHVPTELMEVISVKFGGGTRSSTTELKARVMCDDGKPRLVTYQSYHSSGSFYEPPDAEESLAWEDGTGAEVL